MSRHVEVRGLQLALYPPGDYVSDVIARTGDFYEHVILEELERRLAELEPGVLVDAGAMLGNHTVYLAEFARHTIIHAFEPLRESYDLLAENTLPYPTVVLHHWALWDTVATVQLAPDPGNRGHTRVSSEGPGRPVSAVPLDALRLEQVRLLKVDVEGAEPRVLAGARATLERSHPLVLIEDWRREYAELLPGYRLAAEWERQHQTFLYEWGG